jgi:hypothetical protein
LQRNSEIHGCIIPTASPGGGRPTSRSHESMGDQGARAVMGKGRGLATRAHSLVNGCAGHGDCTVGPRGQGIARWAARRGSLVGRKGGIRPSSRTFPILFLLYFCFISFLFPNSKFKFPFKFKLRGNLYSDQMFNLITPNCDEVIYL